MWWKSLFAPLLKTSGSVFAVSGAVGLAAFLLTLVGDELTD